MRAVIKRLDESHILFEYYYQNNKYFSHRLECPPSVIPLDDSLFRVAILSRPADSKKYKVEGVKISEITRNHFQKQLDVLIDVNIDSELDIETHSISTLPNNNVLCFSGGFDSLATKALLGKNINLLSIEFGGGFERESLFFKKFDTTIIKWALRGFRSNQKIKFNESVDWRFLLAPALLFRKHDEEFAILTGTIMEAAPSWFSGVERPEFIEYARDYGPSVALVNPIACLTEYSTTLIVSKYMNKDDIQLSLKSLASPKSIKAFRKKILLSLVTGTELPAPHKKMRKHRYGSSFADDFLAIYFSWKCGKTWTLNNYVNQLPDEIESIDMSFVEKANQLNLYTLDKHLKSHILLKLSEYNIENYESKDFKELEKVKEIILSKKGIRKGVRLIAYRIKIIVKSYLLTKSAS